MNINYVKKQLKRVLWVIIKNIGHLVRYFSRVPGGNIGESCSVLGRGESLVEFKGADKSRKECFLANFDDKTVTALGVRHILDKNLTIVSNYEEPILFKHLLFRLKIRNVYVAMFKKQPYVWRNRKRGYGFLEIYGVNVLLLPSNIGADFTVKLRNTGLIAIHLAASIHKKIILYGFDFYQSGYICGALNENNLSEEQIKELRSISTELINIFYKVVDYWPDVEFEIVTYAVLLYSRPNLKVIHINKPI
jgi:hypothetical protein